MSVLLHGLTAVIETIGGLWALFLLGLKTRFRMSGPYWAWRTETAFGRGYPERRAELLIATLAYARWMYRTRRWTRR